VRKREKRGRENLGRGKENGCSSREKEGEREKQWTRLCILLLKKKHSEIKLACLFKVGNGGM